MKKSELVKIIKECYEEIIAENAESIEKQIENLYQQKDRLDTTLEGLREKNQKLPYNDRANKYRSIDQINQLKSQSQKIQLQIDKLHQQLKMAKEQEHKYSNIRK